jgi:DNA-binding XRE family transcriptional regulator
LKQWRAEKDLTQAHLAKLAVVSRKTRAGPHTRNVAS